MEADINGVSRLEICSFLYEVDNLIEENCLQGFFTFVKYKSEKGFGMTGEAAIKNAKDKLAKGGRLLWSGPNIPFDGHAYIPIAEKILICHQGKDINLRQKEAYAARNAAKNDHHFGRKKTLVQNTKKCDCPARIVVKQVVRLTDCWVDKNDDFKKKMAKKQLLAKPLDSVKFDVMYFLSLPHKNAHKNHLMGKEAGLREPVDRQIRDKIRELVQEGAHKVSEVERNIKSYVYNVLFKNETPPDVTRRRYFPTRTDIENIIYTERVKFRYSKIDQEKFLCIDESVMDQGNETSGPDIPDEAEQLSETRAADDNEGSSDGSNDLDLAPKKSSFSTLLAVDCRSKLKHMINTTHLIKDNDGLQLMRDTLNDLSFKLQKYVPNENGVVLESSPKKKKKRVAKGYVPNVTPSRSGFKKVMKKLPSRKFRHHPYLT